MPKGIGGEFLGKWPCILFVPSDDPGAEVVHTCKFLPVGQLATGINFMVTGVFFASCADGV